MRKNLSKAYYHISPIENKDSILSQGLKSEHKQIFVSDCEEQLILIANSQIGTLEYSVFEIMSTGIKGKILWDNVAEIGAGHQFIIKQNVISPEHIKHLRDVKWNYWDLAEYANRKKNKIIFGVDDDKYLESMISRSREWCEHYNKKYSKSIQFEERLQ